MKKSRVGLLVAAALGILPATSWAQGKGAKGAAASGEAAGAEASGEAAPAGGEPAAGEGDGSTPADEGEVPAEGGGLEEICKIDPAACPNLDMEKEAARPLRENIYAMQQIFALRARRFELMPYWGFTFNDQFVGHPGPGLGLNYYITNVLAIGVNGNYFGLFNVDSKFNAQVRRSARVAVPLTEYNWGANLNFTYVPAYGKFAGFGDFIFHYDAYVVGGVGAISTRPIPVIDPDNRNFEFDTKIAFNAGIGLRIFFNRWFAADLEMRDYIFPDKLESLTINEANPTAKGDWYEKKARLTNAVQAQVGVSIFLPFSFEYRLPK
ncbi:MAG TPA: outer membrane beta-barrel domain-containing protein [Polyangiaceae bacterium]|nr:outer membrane beta-barrel domain-containing protein [Polyangiaceae bacterium]